MNYKMRNGNIEDVDRMTQIEATVFPPEEAAPWESYEYRLKNISKWFFVGEVEGVAAGAVVGRLTTLDVFNDDLYENIEIEEGTYLAILSVMTDPEYQKQGIAGELLKLAILKAKKEGLAGVTLACKDNLVHYYAQFGFELVGISESVHGGVRWNDMRIIF